MVFSVETLKPFRLAFDRLFLGIRSTSEQFAGAGNTCGLSKHEHYKLLAPKAEGFFYAVLIHLSDILPFPQTKVNLPSKNAPLWARLAAFWAPSGPSSCISLPLTLSGPLRAFWRVVRCWPVSTA